MQKRSLSLVTAITCMLAVAGSSQRPNEPSSDSIWGGEHIKMTVTASGAEIEFDCATGTISEPIPFDSKSEFKVKGTYLREHGGPVRENESSRAASATYSGKVENGKMHLSVTVGGKNPYQESFVLQRGHTGQVFKCR
jgi:hypothetical protein